MSGPITAGFFLLHGTLLLSAQAIREARAMKREFGEVREQSRAREDEQIEIRRGAQQARLSRVAAMRARASRQQARLSRLRSLAQALGESAPEVAARIPSAVPVAPTSDGDDEWTGYLAALDAAVRDVEALLAEAGGRFKERLRTSLAATADAPGIDDVLSTYMLQREMHVGLDALQSERLAATAARILSRLDLPQGVALPAELEALARGIVLAPSLERGEALALELRHAVQRQREAIAAQTAEAEQAAALVLEQSLRDLGYEVEDIEATLFASGGTVHFRRPGWENYFVRLRVDPREQTVNFNVVRARGDEESSERRRIDALAEDRWCAEFPRLMETLASRGLRLEVTRRLDAGEIPVQVVDRSRLPAIAADEAPAASRPPMARPLG